MTAPLPPIPPQVQAARTVPAVTGRPGVLTRLKLTEPVRLYFYGLAAVALLGLTMAGVVSGEWADYWFHVLGVLLVVPAAEAARASVYSPRSHVQGILEGGTRAAAGQDWP